VDDYVTSGQEQIEQYKIKKNNCVLIAPENLGSAFDSGRPTFILVHGWNIDGWTGGGWTPAQDYLWDWSTGEVKSGNDWYHTFFYLTFNKYNLTLQRKTYGGYGHGPSKKGGECYIGPGSGSDYEASS
jgi:hypothetical protein